MQSHRGQGSELGAKLVDCSFWVFPVVRSLLECLSDGSYPEDLKRIIEIYPDEFHELYEHIFKRIKPSHPDETFRPFQAIHYAQNIESKISTALCLLFLERDKLKDSTDSLLEILKTKDLQERLSAFETWLRTRFCGLFEVQYFQRLSSQEISLIREGWVTFLHRTISDFLNEAGVRQVIERETLPFSAKIYKRLIAFILYFFKAWTSFCLKEMYKWKTFAGEIKSFLIYGKLCETEMRSKQIEYIEEFKRRLT